MNPWFWIVFFCGFTTSPETVETKGLQFSRYFLSDRLLKMEKSWWWLLLGKQDEPKDAAVISMAVSGSPKRW